MTRSFHKVEILRSVEDAYALYDLRGETIGGKPMSEALAPFHSSTALGLYQDIRLAAVIWREMKDEELRLKLELPTLANYKKIETSALLALVRRSLEPEFVDRDMGEPFPQFLVSVPILDKDSRPLPTKFDVCQPLIDYLGFEVFGVRSKDILLTQKEWMEAGPVYIETPAPNLETKIYRYGEITPTTIGTFLGQLGQDKLERLQTRLIGCEAISDGTGEYGRCILRDLNAQPKSAQEIIHNCNLAGTAALARGNLLNIVKVARQTPIEELLKMG